MTIIVVKDGVMAADSFEFANDVGYPRARPKIERLSDGSLFGCAGGNLLMELTMDWAKAGMDQASKPEVMDDDRIGWLWLRPDGTLRFGDQTFRSYPALPPYGIGIVSAVHIAEGAMAAGMSAAEAVALVLDKRCANIGGPIQVEHLREPNQAGRVAPLTDEEMARVGRGENVASLLAGRCRVQEPAPCEIASHQQASRPLCP